MDFLKKNKLIVIPIAVLVIGYALFRAGTLIKYKMTDESNLFSMGQVAMNQGNCSKAIDIFNAFLKKDPNHVPTLKFKLDCLKQQKDYEEALFTATKIMNLELNEPNKVVLSEIYREMGKPEEAAKILNVTYVRPTPSVSPTPVPSNPPTPAKKGSQKK